MTSIRQRSLLGDCRGAAVTVEFLVIVPLLTVIMVSGYYLFDVGRVAQHVQKEARSCAWPYAIKRCKGAPTTGCKLKQLGEIDDNSWVGFQAPRAAISAALPFLAKTLDLGLGTHFEARVSASTISADYISGKSVTYSGLVANACSSPYDEWRFSVVRQTACAQFLGPWCP
jgi:hypothetical protein